MCVNVCVFIYRHTQTHIYVHASCIKSLPTPLKHDRHIFLLLSFLRACLSISAAALISLSGSNTNVTYDKPLNLRICQPGHVSLLNNTRPYQQSKTSDPSSLNRDCWPLAVGPKQGVRLRGGWVSDSTTTLCQVKLTNKKRQGWTCAHFQLQGTQTKVFVLCTLTTKQQNEVTQHRVLLLLKNQDEGG